MRKLVERFNDWFIDAVDSYFLIGFLAFIGLLLAGSGWVIWIIYQDSQSETFTLSKNHWQCSQSHMEVRTTYISNGKQLTPYVYSEQVCDAYTRK